jgi:hypothetical protein
VKYQWRLRWKREGEDRISHHREYATEKTALRWMRWMTEGPEKPDEKACCDGFACGCGGLTNKQQWDEHYEDMRPIVFMELSRREVGEWEKTADWGTK